MSYSADTLTLSKTKRAARGRNWTQFVKFTCTGAAVTLLDYALYRMLLSQFHPPVPVAVLKLSSMLLCMLIGFLVNRLWVFEDHATTLLRSLLRYYLSQPVNIATNVCVNSLLLGLGGSITTSYIGGVAAGFCCNFLLSKYFIFTGSSRC